MVGGPPRYGGGSGERDRRYRAGVSEDRRAARNPHEPTKEGSNGAHRWADYLEWLREDIIGAVLSLSPADQRTSHLPSGWSPLELLSHVLHMEQRWFVWGFRGEQVSRPWGDWNVPEPWTADDSDETRPSAHWQVADDTTAEELATRLRAVGERTRAALLDHPLDTPGTMGGRFGDDPPTLEWICFHVLSEYARHAGQLDVATEIMGS
ncbi:MAG: hypothetical protein AVDCRST_MAG34-2962 [uncultured Nocardioidaceae bacterium]|uniref:Mini-circle protein n=1 Tax=uncultured Nocardioidaceae bacterium TaxID=253824 RepID=A0A6J4MSV9_9ACTN|nr:MAG: hypothetical protein AVDCRST_MAG34-2962 [uncultured Nocardioidaceae bacterium]